MEAVSFHLHEGPFTPSFPRHPALAMGGHTIGWVFKGGGGGADGVVLRNYF